MARRPTLELGHDAFLDIVANLVGILIILLAIVGSQSAGAIRKAAAAVEPPPTEDAVQSVMDSAETIALRSAAAQADSDRLESMIDTYDRMIDAKRNARDRLLDLIAVAKEAWDDAQKLLDAGAVAAAKQSVALETAQAKLASLDAQMQQLENATPPPIAVEHLPTPMARAVFNEEIHLRIKDNLVSVVPLQRLLDEIKHNVQRSVSSARSGQSIDTAGPVNGYVARYVIEKQSGMLTRNGQVRRAVQVEMAGMVVTPLSEPIGQSIDVVTAARSALDVELAGRDPTTTTITAWVYPDSFASFGTVKRYLYQKGFATAARPLKFGMPIGASPHGSKSQAQ